MKSAEYLPCLFRDLTIGRRGVFVEFVDQTLVRLADANTRAALFDQLALEHLVASAYDSAALGIVGPFQPSFDELRLGISLPAIPQLEGNWQQAGRSEATEIRVTVAGLAEDSIRIDGLWRGSIIGRVGTLDSPITKVDGQWADLRLEGIDAEIAAALGGLPGEPQLEQERRARLLGRLRSGLAHPGVVTDVILSNWLRAQGHDSVGSLLGTTQRQLATAGLSVTFAAPPAGPPLPRPLPVTVALLIRDAGASIADLLAESSRVRDRMQALGGTRPRSLTGMKRGFLVGWLLPEAVFDDPGWPGANRDARRLAASAWLGAEGIALVPIT